MGLFSTLRRSIGLAWCATLVATPPVMQDAQRRALFESLQPRSLHEMAAFAELFPGCSEGRQARQRVWALLSGEPSEDPPPAWPADLVHKMVNRFIFPQSDPPPVLSAEQKHVLLRLQHRLKHRHLLGRLIETEEDLQALPVEEIDLARGLLLTQRIPIDVIESYEHCLDLMALQVLAQLPEDPSPIDLLRALNDYVFVQQRFRFPAHSRMTLEIDQWTLLSQVMDRRKGVCQGVSQLYLCLAQRLGLPLEIITPPGHIYIRYHQGDLIWNIETTAHGVHLPTHAYLGLTTKALSTHTLKEVIGMSLYNAAAVPLHQGKPDEAIALYLRAKPYMGDEPILHRALGIAYFMAGQLKEARETLEPLRAYVDDQQIVPMSLIGEILDGEVDAEGLALLFEQVDPTHVALKEYAQRLRLALERSPRFFSGREQLAVIYLQLGRLGEALSELAIAYDHGARDAQLLYLLTELYLARLDVHHAARHAAELRALLATAEHVPPLLERVEERIAQLGGGI